MPRFRKTDANQAQLFEMPDNAARTARKPQQQLTSAQQLGSIVKSARDIMRKDKGLNGDLDRLPMLTWIMFLKFLDDTEQILADEAALEAKPFREAIEPPYRWRDWAANPAGITGDALKAFVNQDEAVRPDGTRGLGLFAYLRSLQGVEGGDRRDVIATVFRGVSNRMESGYLLRDVINLVNGIHFASSEEIHTLGHLYESLLKEMRDAAGDSGEFYTPRAVVRFMVAAIDPRLTETVHDPACGTGGFLTEAFEHLRQQAKKADQHYILQKRSLSGGEAKSLPYLLAQMNLLLHGLETPKIEFGNSLATPLNDIGDKQRVDIILTNPPFGGEEERGIQANFPNDKQTSETALLFLLLIMRKIKRNPKPGRAAVVVPNGTLYEGGVAARIREQLLREFNLHTVIRLPKGVFEPYTDIATNLLFFDASGSTQGVWFYEHPLPLHRAHLKNQCYTATDGITWEEFQAELSWWNNRVSNDQAWYVPFEDLERSRFDLAITHPKHAAVSLPEPSELVSRAKQHAISIVPELERLAELMDDLRSSVQETIELREVLKPRDSRIIIQSGTKYRRPRVQLHFRGAKVRDVVDGSEIGTTNQTVMHTNDLIMSRIDARNGAMAIVPSELDGSIATNDFPVFEIDTTRIIPSYLRFVLFQPAMIRVYEKMSRGSTNRRRIEVDEFLSLHIPAPALDAQSQIASNLEEAERRIGALNETLRDISQEVGDLLAAALHATFEG